MSSKPPPRRPEVFTPWTRRFTDEKARDLGDTIALYEEVHTAWRASAWAKPNIIDAFTAVTLDRVAEYTKLPSSPLLLASIEECIRELLSLEDRKSTRLNSSHG